MIRAGAGAVKLEGGRKRSAAIQAILDAEIPVMGHIGLTPQSIHALGGFKVQGKELDAAKALADDACALADAGCFAIVLECVPDGVARMITDAIAVPTIGIGAGRHCDGQVLVWHDLLGFSGTDRHAPKFVREYAALEARRDRNRSRSSAPTCARARIPSSAETYHMTDRWPSNSVSTESGRAGACAIAVVRAASRIAAAPSSRRSLRLPRSSA